MMNIHKLIQRAHKHYLRRCKRHPKGLPDRNLKELLEELKQRNKNGKLN